MEYPPPLSSFPQPQLRTPTPPSSTPPQPLLSASPLHPSVHSEFHFPQQVHSTPNQHLMHKNNLQQYCQRSSIPLPAYQTVNEGFPHAPKFRSTVVVDGKSFTSSSTFSHRKAAEQDVAKLALDFLPKTRKDNGCSINLSRELICQDTAFCKLILNEFAVKMNVEKCTYNTVRSDGLLPIFISSLVFNGVTYTGEAGKNKKEAEQLAARAAIVSLLADSAYATSLSEVIKSKLKLYAALHKVKDLNTPAPVIAQPSARPQSISGVYVSNEVSAALVDNKIPVAGTPPPSSSALVSNDIPVAVTPQRSSGPQSTSGVPLNNEFSTALVANNIPAAVTPQLSSTASISNSILTAVAPQRSSAALVSDYIPVEVTPQLSSTVLVSNNDLEPPLPSSAALVSTNIPIALTPQPSSGGQLFVHGFKLPKPDSSSSQPVSLPIEFVPPASEQPVVPGASSSSSKKRRKNKRKANKKLRIDGQ